MHNGDTPLYRASLRGRFEIVKILIEAGANVNQVNFLGPWSGGIEGVSEYTPLMIAVSREYFDIAKLLIDAGADMVPSLMLESCFDNHQDTLRFLIENGADVNCSEYGSTPLTQAIEYSCPTIIDLLIEAGATRINRDMITDRCISLLEKTEEKIAERKRTITTALTSLGSGDMYDSNTNSIVMGFLGYQA